MLKAFVSLTVDICCKVTTVHKNEMLKGFIYWGREDDFVSSFRVIGNPIDRPSVAT